MLEPLSSLCCTCYYIEITVHPQSVNTTINSTVSFTCEATSAVAITFEVNNISAASPNVTSRGFTLQSESLNGGVLTRVLIAIAFEDNNNTNISCTAFGSPMNKDSDIAVLRIQGELML